MRSSPTFSKRRFNPAREMVPFSPYLKWFNVIMYTSKRPEETSLLLMHKLTNKYFKYKTFTWRKQFISRRVTANKEAALIQLQTRLTITFYYWLLFWSSITGNVVGERVETTKRIRETKLIHLEVVITAQSHCSGEEKAAFNLSSPLNV